MQGALGPDDHERERMLWVSVGQGGQGSEKGGGDGSAVHTLNPRYGRIYKWNPQQSMHRSEVLELEMQIRR